MGSDVEIDLHVHGVIVAMLMDPRNEGHGLVLDAESNFGSMAFDNYFSRIPLDYLLGFLRNYAVDNEEGNGGIKDFLGTVAEYRAMPVSSLRERMQQAAKRALNAYNRGH